MNSQQAALLNAYHDALFAEMFDSARAIITKLERDNTFWQPLVVAMPAELLDKEGHFRRAIDLLTSCIESGQDLIDGCLDRRAGLYFSHRRFRDAKREYQAVLDSRVPHAVTYFHANAAFRIAWMLALEGSPEYETYLARSANLEGDFFFGCLVGPQDVRNLYERQRARRAD